MWVGCLTQALPVLVVMQALYKLTGETKWRYTLKSCVGIVTGFSVLYNVLNYERIKAMFTLAV
jgi:hypothetical protein